MMRYDDKDLEEVKAAIDWEKEETNEEEEYIIVYLSDKKENTFNKKLAPLEKSLVTTLFDYRKWNRPLRYIKNDHFERVVRDENSQFFSDSNDNQNSVESYKNTEFAVVHYSREPDYCRDLIRGSMRPQRRKTVTYKLFQGTAHSPLFLEIMGDYAFLFGDLVYDISQYLKEYFRKPGTDNSDFLAFEKTIEQKEIEENKDESEIRLRQIEEAWESILYGLIIRSFVLLFQSIFRKYILLPSLIITKNIIRILLFQNPEWSEDLRDWRKEVHIYCTYQGVPVSHTALPTNWFWEGIQIRILFPFVLKPWHNKVRSTGKKIYRKKKIH
ncbi:hypothetical protein RYX36_018325 [Vicia faba]